MVFEIHFSRTLEVPLSFHWGEDKYEACPDCVRAHEVRSCHGETKVSFEICEKHAKAAKDRFFDDGMLNDIRTLCHPFHSPVPTYPVTGAGITAQTREELKEMVKEKCPTLHHYFPWTLHSSRQDRLRLWNLERLEYMPYPKIIWVHAMGCMYGAEPDVIFKSHEDVEAMDQYAKERLANINALLDAGVDCELGPDRDAELASKLDQAQEYHSCIVNSEGDLPSPSPFDKDPVVTESFLANMAESEAQTLLREEKTRLEECLATSALAKGMYFKRCNNAWISAVGEMLPYGRLWEQLEKEVYKERPRPRISDPSYGRIDWDSVRKGRLQFPIQKRDDETRSTIATTSSTVSGSTTYTVSATSWRVTTPPASNRTPTEASSATSIASQAPSPKDPNRLIWHDMSVTKIIRTEPSFGYAVPSPVPSPNVWSKSTVTDIGRQTCGQEDFFAYKTSMLLAREEMVRSGQAKPENLIVTSWGYNRQMRISAGNREAREKGRIENRLMDTEEDDIGVVNWYR